MSSVRMCDRCGTIFSEAQPGWQTFAGATVEEDDDGRSTTHRTQFDACPECAVPTGRKRKLTPRLIAAAAPILEAETDTTI